MNGNYDASVRLSNEAKNEILCWITNSRSSANHWFQTHQDGFSEMGKIYQEAHEKAYEINHIEDTDVRQREKLSTYQSNAGSINRMFYVRDKGGIKFANEVWVSCTSKSMRVSAAPIRGTQTTEADSFSRNFNEVIDSKLIADSQNFGYTTLEFLAFWINHQTERCISWKANSKAIAIDNVPIKLRSEFYHFFPSFILLGKLRAKIH